MTVVWWDRKDDVGWRFVACAGLALLIAYGCGGSSTTEDRATESGGSGGRGGAGRAGASGTTTGGVAGTTGAGARGGAGSGARGGTGATGGTDRGGAGGEAGSGEAGSGGGSDVLCEPDVVLPDDTCAYPESLGGGDEPNACGVTPGAWYPIGDSDLSVWPELVQRDTPGGLDGMSYLESLVLDSADRPIVSLGCTVLAWNGSVWEERTGLPASARDCRLGVDTDDRLFVSYFEHIADEQNDLFAARWDGDTWEALGVVAIATADESIHGEFEFDADGTPYIFWTGHSVDCSHYGVHRWDESAGEWQSMHPDRPWELTYLCYALDARFTLGPDGPVVGAIGEEGDEVILLGFDGAEWTDILDSRLRREILEGPGDFRMTQDASGALILGWPTDESLRLFRRSETNWLEIAPDETTLSSLPSKSRYSVATTLMETPSGLEGNIHLRRFENCSWRGISASNRGGGISNSLGSPGGPRLAVGRTRVCVAWREFHLGSFVFPLRCHDLPEP